ncbi:hypothetical protein HELRODRAFT_89289 [Helobdella robusta]|uniref:BRO1 domain-containing protein n=1 Tax=Helobdella robusta TaxID=6412 RepID=T1G7B4_HELRO|nr:hypothetical protein HELRODRAFT_89289 [Helobdella robusta]ESN93154.1 hypothetical protein HELRODRAFT_89289 [Helobdella robusta]
MWFHRNYMKSTEFTTFELGSVTRGNDSINVCSEVRKSRIELLERLKDPYNQIDIVNESLDNYLSLLHGFIYSLDDQQEESQLRYIVNYKWSNSVYNISFCQQSDSLFECLSMLYSVAIWYSKHAAAISVKSNLKDNDALEVFKSLKTAAGIFLFVKITKSNLKRNAEQFSDLDDNVLEAYYLQCLGEAQEVSLARSIEMKHKPELIASLSYETSQIFKKAVDLFSNLNHKLFLKWKLYLQFKCDIYMAGAFNYYGELKLSEDYCGEAIKYAEEGKSNYTKAEQRGKLYLSTDGPGFQANLLTNSFFLKLGSTIHRTLDKCLLENGLIYHHKIPAKVEELDLKATYGVVTADAYQLPKPKIWTSDIYKSFQVNSNMNMESSKDSKKKDKCPAPVNEIEIKVNSNEDKYLSGCVIA